MDSVAQQVVPRALAQRYRIAWSSIGLVALAIALRMADPALIERPRLAFFDFLQSAWPQSHHDSRVVIVDIDEASLASVGQWPWPRSIVARLTAAIAAMEPAVIGIDILFPESDRLSPEQFARSLPAAIDDATRAQLLALPANDELLARSFGRVPVVLAMAAQPAGGSLAAGRNGLPSSAVTETGADPGAFLTAFDGLVANFDSLDAAASGRGMLTLPPDGDGRARRRHGLSRPGGRGPSGRRARRRHCARRRRPGRRWRAHRPSLAPVWARRRPDDSVGCRYSRRKAGSGGPQRQVGPARHDRRRTRGLPRHAPSAIAAPASRSKRNCSTTSCRATCSRGPTTLPVSTC
jgi:CHASE2 domain